MNEITSLLHGGLKTKVKNTSKETLHIFDFGDVAPKQVVDIPDELWQKMHEPGYDRGRACGQLRFLVKVKKLKKAKKRKKTPAKKSSSDVILVSHAGNELGFTPE